MSHDYLTTNTILTILKRYYSFGRGATAKYINISTKDDFNYFIKLSQVCRWQNQEEKKYNWVDITLIENYLLISSGEDGIGLFYFTEPDMMKNGNDLTSRIQYYNPWDKPLRKILLAPNGKEKLILIFKTGDFTYDCELVRKSEVLSLYTEMDDATEDDEPDYDRDYFNAMTDGQLGDYDDFEGSMDDIDNWTGR